MFGTYSAFGFSLTAMAEVVEDNSHDYAPGFEHKDDGCVWRSLAQ